MVITATVNIVGYSASSITVAIGDFTGIETLYRNGVYIQSYNHGSNFYPDSYVDTGFNFDVAYIYSMNHLPDPPGGWSYSNTVTPKDLVAPGNLVAWSDGGGNLTWANHGSPYDRIRVKRDGATVDTLGGSATGYYDSSLGQNSTATYWVEGEIDGGYGYRASNTDSFTAWAVTVADTLTLTDSVPGAGIEYAVTVSDILTLTDAVTATITAGVTVSDVLTLTDIVTAATIFNLTVSDTLTLTDSVSASQTLRTNYSYYLGSTAGAIYAYDSQYLSDAGAAINGFWNSKRIDFADQAPDIIDKWKTLYKITIHYEDLSANTLIVIHVSTDGGTTWTTSGKTVGTGAGTIKEQDYFFIKTGRMFNFRVESSGTATNFKIISLKAEYDVGGEYFSVT